MKIGDEVYIHGYVDEIRKDTVIIRNKGGYFGTDLSEVVAGPERTPGEWIYSADDDGESYICSQCMTEFEVPGNDDDRDFTRWVRFCPVCGSAMEGKK